MNIIDPDSITPIRLMNALNSMIEDCPICKNLVLYDIETLKTHKIVSLKLTFKTVDTGSNDQNEVSILLGSKEYREKMGDHK